MTIVVLGSINMDVVTGVPHIPRPGETVISSSRIDRFPGGKGANQAVAAARMGASTCLVGAVGADDYGRDLLEYLSESGVVISHVARIRDCATGQAFIAVAETGENAIVVVSGANSKVAAPDLAFVQPSTRAVYLAQSELPADVTTQFLGRARAKAGTVIWNAAPADPQRRRDLALADVVVVNELELASCAASESVPSSQDELVEMARSLLTGEGQHIVITRGAEGVLAVSHYAHHQTEGHRVPVVDTTGAGDCFCGSLAAALDQGRSLLEAIAVGNAAAAISVGRHGAASSIPMRTEVDAFLSEARTRNK